MSHPQGADRRSAWAGLDAYPRFYAPIAVGLFCFSFATMFADQVRDNASIHFGSVWELASRPDGGPAILAIMLMGALVALLVRMSVRPSRSSGWPLIIAVLSVIALIMLFVRPGTGSARPDLADGGAVLTALRAVLLVVTVVHLSHLAQIRALFAASRGPGTDPGTPRRPSPRTPRPARSRGSHALQHGRSPGNVRAGAPARRPSPRTPQTGPAPIAAYPPDRAVPGDRTRCSMGDPREMCALGRTNRR